jgi:hypothetical protein
MMELVERIKEEIDSLQKKLKEEDKWEFIDPLELKHNSLQEFSIYNLKALFFNLNKLNRINKYTAMSVFLIWVSKELLEGAYVEICIVAFVFIYNYWKNVQNAGKFDPQ